MVYTTVKPAKEPKTFPAGTAEAASLVRIKPYTVQGCLPTSRTIQPAS